MQAKFLKSVVEDLINKQAVPIIDLLLGKKDVNEFLIAKKLNLTINQTRNILYKLSDYGLVSFIRKKDKRKGWYIYFWTLNIHQSLKLLEKNLKKQLESLEEELKNRTEKRFYMCNTCSIEVSEEVALLNDFVCSECEEVYELSDDKDVHSELERNVEKIKKEISLVEAERKKEEEKIEKKKERKIKKAEREKKKKREERAKERAKEREKEKKKKEKEGKSSKKKTVKKKTRKVPKKKASSKKTKKKANKKAKSRK